MRWHLAATSVLVLVVMTGCPSEFGKDGRISKAVRKDSLELVRKHCDKKTYEQFCGGNKRYTQECRDTCGE